VSGPDSSGSSSSSSKSHKGSAPTAAEQELKALKALGCRQLLADFTQSNVEVKMGPPDSSPDGSASGKAKAARSRSNSNSVAAVEARQLTMALPTLATDPRTEQTHHCGWCDRCPRDQESTLQLVSAVPEWNADVQRLTMCFEDAHVREHSSKNFLVHEVEAPLLDSMMAAAGAGGRGHDRHHHHHHHHGHDHDHDHAGPKSLRDVPGYSGRAQQQQQQQQPAEKRACLQFGKSSPQLFTLSYRYPMSPMQGFGVALSHFNWMPDK
jgi:hypothetical protein